MFAKGRGIELVIDAIRNRKKSDIAVVFMGRGVLQSTIIDAVSANCGIYFQAAVPPSELLDYTRCADYGISIIENTCLSYYYCMPNKLFEFLAAGLPVVVSNMLEMSKLVQENGIGVVVAENTVDSLNVAIDSIIANDTQDLRSRVIRTANGHSWELQEKKMFIAYSALIKRKSQL